MCACEIIKSCSWLGDLIKILGFPLHSLIRRSRSMQQRQDWISSTAGLSRYDCDLLRVLVSLPEKKGLNLDGFWVLLGNTDSRVIQLLPALPIPYQSPWVYFHNKLNEKPLEMKLVLWDSTHVVQLCIKAMILQDPWALGGLSQFCVRAP